MHGNRQNAAKRDRAQRLLGGIVEVRRLQHWDRPFPPHVHDYPVIGLVRCGTRQLTCDGDQFTLATGQLMVLNPGSVHSCIQTGDAPLTYDSMALVGLPACPPLRGPVVDDAEAVAAFEDALSQIGAGGADDEAEEALWLLIDALADPNAPKGPAARDAHDSAPNPCARDAADHARAAAAMEAHLRAHLAEPMSLEDIARVAGLTRFSALRSFAAAFGITPMRYLASLRVEAARGLLAAGVPCSEVAARTGFADQAHLTRTFRDRLGLTPAAYQRAVTGDTASRGARP